MTNLRQPAADVVGMGPQASEYITSSGDEAFEKDVGNRAGVMFPSMQGLKVDVRSSARPAVLKDMPVTAAAG